jgi:hypothetical protein
MAEHILSTLLRKENMKTRFQAILPSVLSILIIVGCSSSQSNGGMPTDIRNPQLDGNPYTTLTEDTERTNNCDGTMPNYTIERSLLQENTTFFNIETEAGAIIKGTPIPEFLLAELEAKIMTAVGNSVSNTYVQTRSIPLVIPEGKFLVHTVTWKETRVRGNIEMVYPDGVATLGFEKIVGIELYDRTSEEVEGCTSELVEVMATDVVSDIETQEPQITEEVSVASPTEIPTTQSLPPTEAPVQVDGPFREHRQTTQVGTGVLQYGTYSDGMADYSDSQLASNHSRIQRIRPEENPDGCSIAFYDAAIVWIGTAVKTSITINDEVIGEILGPTGRQGYLFYFEIHQNDKVCVTYYEPSGFHIVFGPDVYYHYDSYCHRDHC